MAFNFWVFHFEELRRLAWVYFLMAIHIISVLIILEGIRGYSFSSDVAIDNITFKNGACKRLGEDKTISFKKLT